MFKPIAELLDGDSTPGVFLREATFAVGARRNEHRGNPNMEADVESLAWQEVHALLLKAIHEELVKIRKGVRT